MLRNLLLVALAMLVAVSCGGGDDEEEPPPNPNGNVGRGTLTIEIPTSEAAYTAPPSANTVDLSGTAFNTFFFFSCHFGGPHTASDTRVTVSWSNAAGGSGTASQSVSCCGFGVNGFLCDHHNSVGHHSWNASIPIVAGTNLVTVIATDPSGNLGRDTITITR